MKKLVIKKFPTNKSPVPGGFTGKVYQIFKEERVNAYPSLNITKN